MERANLEEIILQKGEDLFMNRGFDGVSTIDIAKEAGCNQALLHYYFRTKKNLFAKIFQNKLQSVQEQMKITANITASLEEKIENIIDAHFSFLRQDPRLPLFIMNELKNNSEVIDTMKETYMATINPFLSNIQMDLDKAFKDGKIREISAFNLMMDIISLDAFIFIAEPVMTNILSYSEEEKDECYNIRKQEIKRLIIQGIKKEN